MEQQYLSQEEVKPSMRTAAASPVLYPPAVATTENAGEKLVQRSDDATEKIRIWLESIGQERPRRFDATTGFIATTLLLLAVYQVWTLIQYFRYPPEGLAQYFKLGFFNYLAMVSSLGVPLALLLKLNRLGRLQADSQTDLQLGPLDIRWVGPLAEALTAPNPRIRSAAARLLTRLLPMMRPQDASLLTQQQRKHLYHKLQANKPGDMELVLAILKAIEHIGDAEALPLIEGLTEVRGWLPRQRCVREAAFRCLSSLEERLNEKGEGAATSSSPFEEGARAERLHEDTAQEESSAAVRAASAEVQSQIELLERQNRTRPEPAMRIGFLIAAWCTIVPFTGSHAWESMARGNYVLGSIWAVLFCLATQFHRFSLSSTQKDAALKLASYDNIDGIGPLAEALEWPDLDLQKAAAAALIRLLPRLKATDAGLLNTKQRACLYRRLNMRSVGNDSQLILAILKALEQVGDEAAVPFVQRLAGRVAFLTPVQKRIRQAAEECLPFLEARAAQQRISQMLLRPSGADEATSEVLLRPAAGTSVTDPAQLLRAGAAKP